MHLCLQYPVKVCFQLLQAVGCKNSNVAAAVLSWKQCVYAAFSQIHCEEDYMAVLSFNFSYMR